MYKVNFKYEPGQKVFDPLGNIGVVIVCGVNLSGTIYKVQAGSMVDWYKEILLNAVHESHSSNFETKGV